MYGELVSKASSASQNEDACPPCPHFLTFPSQTQPITQTLTQQTVPPGPPGTAAASSGFLQFVVRFEMGWQPPAASQHAWFALGESLLLQPGLTPELGASTGRSERAALRRALSLPKELLKRERVS